MNTNECRTIEKECEPHCVERNSRENARELCLMDSYKINKNLQVRGNKSSGGSILDREMECTEDRRHEKAMFEG